MERGVARGDNTNPLRHAEESQYTASHWKNHSNAVCAATLSIGVLCLAPGQDERSNWFLRAASVGLAIVCILFLACLRFDRFDEWTYNVGMEAATRKAEEFTRDRPNKMLGVDWSTVKAAAFYQREFDYGYQLVDIGLPPARQDIDLYLLSVVSREQRVLQEAGYRVIYENPVSGLRLLVAPGVE